MHIYTLNYTCLLYMHVRTYVWMHICVYVTVTQTHAYTHAYHSLHITFGVKHIWNSEYAHVFIMCSCIELYNDYGMCVID